MDLRDQESRAMDNWRTIIKELELEREWDDDSLPAEAQCDLSELPHGWQLEGSKRCQSLAESAAKLLSEDEVVWSTLPLDILSNWSRLSRWCEAMKYIRPDFCSIEETCWDLEVILDFVEKSIWLCEYFAGIHERGGAPEQVERSEIPSEAFTKEPQEPEMEKSEAKSNTSPAEPHAPGGGDRDSPEEQIPAAETGNSAPEQATAEIIEHEGMKIGPVRPASPIRGIELSGNVIEIDGKPYRLKPNAVRLWERWKETGGEPIAQADFPSLQISKVIRSMPPPLQKLITPGRPHQGPSVRRLQQLGK